MHGPFLVSFVCVRCVFLFLRLLRGLLLWGIQFLFFFLLLISHREQLLLVQGHQMRDLPPTPRNRSSGRLPSTHLSLKKKTFPEESGSSRMSMSWIPGFILVLIQEFSESTKTF